MFAKGPSPLFPIRVTLGKSNTRNSNPESEETGSDPKKEPHVKVTMLPDYLLEEEDFAARTAGRLAVVPRAEDEDDIEEDDDVEEDEDQDEDDEDFDDDWEEVDDDDDLDDDDEDDEDEDDLDDDEDDDWDDDEEEEEEEEEV